MPTAVEDGAIQRATGGQEQGSGQDNNGTECFETDLQPTVRDDPGEISIGGNICLRSVISNETIVRVARGLIRAQRHCDLVHVLSDLGVRRLAIAATGRERRLERRRSLVARHQRLDALAEIGERRTRRVRRVLEEVGEVIEISTPGGVKAYEILKVEWI